MSSLTDHFENQLIDFIFRGQALTLPGSLHIGLFTVAAGEGGGQTEVAGGSYARAAVTRSLTAFAGTQAAGSTVASTGTGGATSNNATITFPAPTANWGSIVGFGVFDAATAGNLLIYAPLAQAKTVNAGDAAPTFAPGQLGFTLS
ncbi:MAG: hypothetical protein KGZ52_02735 [Xanthomonadaceae bacterium]|nr:hypothetical protein [Xanthomonadaceae bacterium]